MRPDIITTAEQTLAKVKIRMMTVQELMFYTTILFSLKIEFTDKFPTAATNGAYLYINPSFFLGLSTDEQLGLILHEILHVALNHMARQGTRDHDKFNEAGDHVINLTLLNAGYKLPANGLWDRQYNGMNTEQVYEKIKNKPKNPNFVPDIIFADPDQQKAVTNQVTSIVMRAQIQAKQAGMKPGSLPAEIDIELDKHINPKLPWNVILANYMSEFAPDDYTMKRFNRRYLPDFYLPTLYSEALCHLSVHVDASGSVMDHEFSHFIHEIHNIRENMHPKQMTVMDFDTRIKNVHELDETVNILKDIKFHGRGGTCIEPVLEWINKNNPEVALIFTDGEFYMPKKFPKTSIIWLIHGDYPFEPKHGRVIRYEIPKD